MDKRKFNKKGYCGWCGKQKGFYRAIGNCGQAHEVCTLCKREWCPKFNEFEQLTKPLLKPLVHKLKRRKPTTKKRRKA